MSSDEHPVLRRRISDAAACILTDECRSAGANVVAAFVGNHGSEEHALMVAPAGGRHRGLTTDEARHTSALSTCQYRDDDQGSCSQHVNLATSRRAKGRPTICVVSRRETRQYSHTFHACSAPLAKIHHPLPKFPALDTRVFDFGPRSRVWVL